MNRKDAYIIAGLIVLAIVGGMILHAYVSSKMAVVQAEQVKIDVQNQINTLRSDLKDSLGAIAKDRQQTKTPQQIVERLPQYVPLPQPIYLQPAQTTTSDIRQNVLPDAPKPQPDGSLVIPSASVEAFWQHETSCREDSLKLGECQKETTLLTQRAESAEKAMKGGGFWSRFRANAKWFIVGGAIGAAAGVAATH